MNLLLISRLLCAILLVTIALAEEAAEIQEETPNDRLFAAVKADDPKAVLAALEEGADINVRGEGKRLQTPVMAAALYGKPEAMKVLLDKGADVTIGEKDGYTPMHGVGFQGRPDIARILLDHGLDPNDRHKDGFTPFHRACWGHELRHTETARVFLEAGVPIDLKAENGETCMDMSHSQTTMTMLEMWQKEHAGDGDKDDEPIVNDQDSEVSDEL